MPEPSSLMPGPAGTESRCAPTTTTWSGSPPRVSAITCGRKRSVKLPVDLEVHGRVLALLVGLQQLVAEGVAGDHRGDRRRRVGLVVDEDRVLPRRRVALVVDDHARGAGRLRQRPLVDEGARAALDERDLAGHAGVVSRRAAAGRAARGRVDDAADREHGSVGELHGRRVGHGDEVGGGLVAVLGVAGDVRLGRRRDHVQDRRLRLRPEREVELVDLRVGTRRRAASTRRSRATPGSRSRTPRGCRR